MRDLEGFSGVSDDVDMYPYINLCSAILTTAIRDVYNPKGRKGNREDFQYKQALKSQALAWLREGGFAKEICEMHGCSYHRMMEIIEEKAAENDTARLPERCG